MFSKVRICLIMAIVMLLICSILATPIGAQEKLKIGFARILRFVSIFEEVINFAVISK